MRLAGSLAGPRTNAGPAAARRLERFGPRACSDLDLLTILAPAADPGALARLAGSLSAAVLSEGDLHELRRSGLRRRETVVLAAAVELGRRIASAWPDAGWQIRTPADLGERLVVEMGRLPGEELRVVVVNTRNAVIGWHTLYRGSLAGAPVRVGEVFRDAVRRQAAGIAVVHNHPSGDPTPSAEDLRITGELARAGRLLDIELLDHLIVGHGRWVSLRALGVLESSPP